MYEISYKLKKEENSLLAKKVIVAPGRTGAKWVQSLAESLNIPIHRKALK